MSSWCFYSAVLLSVFIAFTTSEVFVEEIGETETILIDDLDLKPEVKPFVDFAFDKKFVENVRSKRATDYSSEAYEEEEEATAGSGSEATYEDEVSTNGPSVYSMYHMVQDTT